MLRERIDLHGHYFPPAYVEALQKNHVEFPDGVKAPEWSLKRQMEYMELLNISYATLSISSPHPFFQADKVDELVDTIRKCNEYGSELQKQYPEKFGILASLPIPEIESSVTEIRYCRQELGIEGFALLSNYAGIYLGDESLESIMEELNKKPTLITIHPTVPVTSVGRVCEELPAPVMEYFFETTRAVSNMLLKGVVHRYPNLKFVVPHGGAFLTILSDRMIPLTNVLLKEKDLDIEGALSNMYYDLAGFSMPKQFELLRKVTDDSHLVYGSDSPYTFLPLCEKQAKDMDEAIDEELQKQIYKENPETLLQETNMKK